MPRHLYMTSTLGIINPENIDILPCLKQAEVHFFARFLSYQNFTGVGVNFGLEIGKFIRT